MCIDVVKLCVCVSPSWIFLLCGSCGLPPVQVTEIQAARARDSGSFGRPFAALPGCWDAGTPTDPSLVYFVQMDSKTHKLNF
jgi:hypothetical protein